MTYFPDLSPYCYAGEREEKTVNIGWISPEHSFTKGKVPQEVISRLKEICKQPVVLSFGFHECEFCHRVVGNGEIRVAGQDILYASPVLIVHYIEEHHYLPPVEFIEAVKQAVFVNGKPERILPAIKSPSSMPIWGYTPRQIVRLYKKPEITNDHRWDETIADETLAYIKEESLWDDQRCQLMIELLRDLQYNKEPSA